MNKLYIADIEESLKSEPVEAGLEGEKFNYDYELGEYDITLSYYRAGKTLCLKLEGEYDIKAFCGRCGDAVVASIPFSEDFFIFPENNDEDADYTYSGDRIDVEPYFREAIVINTPDRIICDEDCRGRCPLCGQNLNDGECSCINQSK